MRIFLSAMGALSMSACATVPNTYAERLAAEGCQRTTASAQRKPPQAWTHVQAAGGYNNPCSPTWSTWFSADNSRDQQRANQAVSFPSEDPR